jgi:hypothetical protein
LRPARQKVRKTVSTKKLGMEVPACNSSYLGDIGRRPKICGLPQAKNMSLYLKNKLRVA